MKRILLTCCIVLLPLISKAQMHEVGLFLGGSNLIGDIGSRKFINSKAPAFGIIYKYNITTRYSFRGSFYYSNIVNKNFYTNDLNRFRTFLSVSNQITEFSAGVEFNFFDFNQHDQEIYITPYVYLGLNYFRYNLFYIDRNQPLIITEYDKDLEFSVPLTLGMKAKLSPQFVLGFEIGARYALTDNLDGSNPVDAFEANPNFKHGALYNNDWYVFTGLTLSFTFGRLPCYCKEK